MFDASLTRIIRGYSFFLKTGERVINSLHLQVSCYPILLGAVLCALLVRILNGFCAQAESAAVVVEEPNCDDFACGHC